MEVFLIHHGIKGQKWGVRRYQNPDGTLTTAGKYRYGYSSDHPSALGRIASNSMSSGKLVLKSHPSNTSPNSGTANKASSKTKGPLQERITSGVKKAGMMSRNGIDDKDIKALKLGTLRSLSDDGIQIAKGSIVQHVMSTPTKDLTSRDYLFVAATEADKKNYGGFFASLTKYRNDVNTMYKMEITVAEDLISPSKKERVNTFLEIYKENPAKVAQQLAEFNKRNYAGQYKETVEQLKYKYENMSKSQLKKMGYYTYANSWFDQEAGTLKDMQSKLSAKGYNAIIDDNDKRSFIQSEAPLIVFNIKQNFGDIKVSELSDKEIRSNMIEWQNMKHELSDEFVYNSSEPLDI